jgi:hypothetical protein
MELYWTWTCIVDSERVHEISRRLNIERYYCRSGLFFFCTSHNISSVWVNEQSNSEINSEFELWTFFPAPKRVWASPFDYYSHLNPRLIKSFITTFRYIKWRSSGIIIQISKFKRARQFLMMLAIIWIIFKLFHKLYTRGAFPSIDRALYPVVLNFKRHGSQQQHRHSSSSLSIVDRVSL